MERLPSRSALAFRGRRGAAPVTAASARAPSPDNPPARTTLAATVSAKAEALTESVIREMTRLALDNDAINLAQGFPDFPAEILGRAGLRPVRPSGAYYIMTDSSALGLGDDVTAARALVEGARVAAVPGSSFYSRPELGAARLRFSFSKRLDTLREAGTRLAEWAGTGSREGPPRR